MADQVLVYSEQGNEGRDKVFTKIGVADISEDHCNGDEEGL